MLRGDDHGGTANAAGTQKAIPVKLTQRLTTLSSGGSRVTNVGTSDGTIAGAGVHGALRATIKILTPAKFAAKGMLFYPTAGAGLQRTDQRLVKPTASIPQVTLRAKTVLMLRSAASLLVSKTRGPERSAPNQLPMLSRVGQSGR